MKELTPSSNQNTKDIERIISRLAEAIQKLPFERMNSSMWIPGEQAVSHDNVQELEADARRAIMQLSILAGSGSADAVIALREIGNYAANELASLRSTSFRRRDSKAFPGPFAELARLRQPVIELDGDLSQLLEILISEKVAIERLTEQEIQDHIKQHNIASRGRFVVNALESLGYPKDLLDEHQRNTSSGSVSYKHPDMILEAQLATIQHDDSKSSQEYRQESTQIVLLSLIQHLLAAELEVAAERQVVDLSQKSTEWPMCVSAFRRDVQERFESLNLGASLPFRPSGSAKKAGRPQKFELGSPIPFAMEYCVALEEARRNRPVATEVEIDDWRNTIKRIEMALKDRKIADRAPQKNRKVHPKKPYHGMSLTVLWTYKAWLLPEFPFLEDGDKPDKSVDLDLWLDAAVARARMMCWNNWEDYEHWPKCVEERRHQSNERSRSAKSVVREKLREGMEKIVAVPRTAR